MTAPTSSIQFELEWGGYHRLLVQGELLLIESVDGVSSRGVVVV